MTINKSQGQTFDRVGLLPPSPAFSHGQLYVAFSRVRDAQSVRVGMHCDGNGRFVTKNFVYAEVDINFSSWGSTGGWIPNYYIFRGKKACSNLRNLTGNSWFTFVKAFNIPTDRCPIPVDTYITSGYDLTKFEDNNLPKVFFYGKYKVVVRYKNVENKEVGCMVSEINFIRPWETPI
eukprot:XP_016657132.1 PREDICTED: uncharacterized protein LOC107882766 [Acyrthosiphon pisum]